RCLRRLPQDVESAEREEGLRVPAAYGVGGQLAAEARSGRGPGGGLEGRGGARHGAPTGVSSAASVWVPGTRDSGSAPAGGRKWRIARKTAYPTAANARNPRIRCQISGGPAFRWSMTRPAAPS